MAAIRITGGPGASRTAMPGTGAADRAQAAPEFLCCDLDGTILATDSAWEAALALLGRRPWMAFLFPFWLVRGRAAFKAMVAQQAELNVATLPVRQEVLDYLRAQAAAGRRLVLATGADRRVACAVADRLGIFETVLASDGTVNLTRERKKEAVERYLAKKEFEYVGDSKADLPVWGSASLAVVVRPTTGLLEVVRRQVPEFRVMGRRKNVWREWLRALRPHHWVKNLLVFLPLVMAHEVRSLPVLGAAALAFAAFGLCASGTYVLNDLLDLEADRRHTTKGCRPFASGALPVWAGVCTAPLLIAAGLVVAGMLGNSLVITGLAGYLAATLIYSFYVKRAPVVDVLMLTGLYLLRILVGGAATAVPLSPWLIGFSMFFLLSLAFAKRHSEIRAQLVENGGDGGPSKRNYAVQDLDMVRQFGVVSGYLSVLVLALYINGSEVLAMYRRPELIWLACPLVLFWISRVWFLANRGKLHEDPIVFAASDSVSYLSGLILLAILYLAV